MEEELSLHIQREERWSEEEVNKLHQEYGMHIQIECISGDRCIDMMIVNLLVAEHYGSTIKHRE